MISTGMGKSRLTRGSGMHLFLYYWLSTGLYDSVDLLLPTPAFLSRRESLEENDESVVLQEPHYEPLGAVG